MPLIPIINIAQKSKLTDTPKFGTVVDNNDPDKLGKIKVTIPGIFEGDPETLPWIRRKQDTTFCGINCQLFDVPEINSIVEVRWPYDDNNPVYCGAPDNQKQTSTIFNENYPNMGGIVFGKMYICFDKTNNNINITNGAVKIECTGEGIINMEAQSDVNINTQANAIINTQGNATINSQGDTNLNSSGNLNVNASNTTFNCSNTTFNGNVRVTQQLTCDTGATGAGVDSDGKTVLVVNKGIVKQVM